DMIELKRFVKREMHYNPEQVQLFTPTPGTISTAMYFTEMASEKGDPVLTERSTGGRNRQKEILVRKEILDRKPEKDIKGTGHKRNKSDRH
ncbi:MAG: YgiQ family radical SAM protein, partial [Mesotoga sp.]|nr:YgiQ family radical SAM protein [Mesotoga sp.]